jgi:hypothetical protein
MLASLDVLIGTVVVLLGVSLIVTIANQTLSTALALRARNLRWGLAMLIQELHPDQFEPPRRYPLFGRDLNLQVSDAVDRVLEYPLVSDSKAPIFWWRLASTVRFEEFIKTILLLGKPPAGPDEAANAIKSTAAPPERVKVVATPLDRAQKAQQALDWLRENHRITEPWFNSVMDRVSQRFAMHMRLYSVAVSFIIVVALGMDTLFILNTLRHDAVLRSGLAAVGGELAKADNLTSDERQALTTLARSARDNLTGDQDVRKLFFQRSVGSIPGMLLSVVLLSLGAPFWFMVLKNLVALRSVVAQKESQERASSSPDVGDQIRVRSF